MKWQPIETAPTSGELFDVWCVEPDCPDMGVTLKEGVRFTAVAMSRDQSGLGYILDNGEWEFLEEDGVYPPWKATHWIPLLELPEDE